MTQTKSNLLLNSEKLHNSLILIQKASSLFGGPYVFPICYHSNMCLRKHSDVEEYYTSTEWIITI
jgi:hypothetical protein